MRAARAAGIVLVVATTVAGCTIGAKPPTDRSSSKETSVVDEAKTTHEFTVDLSGPMPDRATLGLTPGRTQVTAQVGSDEPIQVTFVLTSGRFTVPASMLTVATPSDYVLDPAHPEVRDDALLPPNEVIATQDITSADQARGLLLAQADLLGLDTTDIERWAQTAPAGPGPSVVLAKHFFAGRARLGYVDVSVGVFISDNAYINWDLSWDPPIPGYAYTTDGIPRPTTS